MSRMPPANTSPEAVALRKAAQAWVDITDKDNLDMPDPGPTLRASMRANRDLLEAAIAYAKVAEANR